MSETQKAIAGGTQYLTFLLGEEELAVDLLRVREIIQYDVVTHVPRMPAWIRGVINLRGSVVPVIDLAVKFGMPPVVTSKATCIVIVETLLAERAATMGVVADAVNQVVDLGPGDVEPPPAFGTAIRADYLVGLAKTGGSRFALVLDVQRVLSIDELLVGETAVAEASRPPTAGAPTEAV